MEYSGVKIVFFTLFSICSSIDQSSARNMTIRDNDGSLKPIYEIMHADKGTINSWIREVGDVNHEDEGDSYHQGGTALMWAVVLGRKDIVEYLVQMGANIDQEVRQTSETALVTAIRNRKLDITDYLVKRGANVNYISKRKEHEWETPLYWAIMNGDKNIVKLLLDRGARLRGISGTEIVWAVLNGNTEIVDLLIKKGANVNAPIKMTFHLNCSYTPLHFATENGNIEMVESLLRSGADINLKNCDGDTALHIAANLDAHKQPERICDYLIRFGANREWRNEFGKTPFEIATMKGNARVISILSTNQMNQYPRYMPTSNSQVTRPYVRPRH